MIVDVTEYVGECREFVVARIKQGLFYGRRDGQSNPAKLEQDLLHGVLCEFGVYKALGTSRPSTEIHDVLNKSFAPDLWLDDVGIEVKCGSYYRGELSWVFQRTGLAKTRCAAQYVVLCSINETDVTLHWKVPTELLLYPLLQEMEKVSLQKTKVALYSDDLENCTLAIPL